MHLKARLFQITEIKYIELPFFFFFTSPKITSKSHTGFGHPAYAPLGEKKKKSKKITRLHIW